MPARAAAARRETSLSSDGNSSALCFAGRTLGCVAGLCFATCHLAAQPAPATEDGTLEEIIVTAQKRVERGQDVAIAVTAMNADTIVEAGVLTLQQLTDLNPSVYFDTAQSFQRNSLQIRGIGTIGNSRGFEGAVGVFIDGVYRSRTGMVLMDLLDINGLEILRGPQSTLFGKNTVAGSISLVSTKPRLDALDGSIDVRLGNFASRYLAGAVNVPLGDAAAVRVAGSHRQKDGFFESLDNGDQYDGTDRSSLKVQLLLEPRENLEVQLIADVARSEANCCWSAALAVAGPTAPLIAAYTALNRLSFVGPPTAERNRFESLNTLPEEEVDDDGLTAIVRFEPEMWLSLRLPGCAIGAMRRSTRTRISPGPICSC